MYAGTEGTLTSMIKAHKIGTAHIIKIENNIRVAKLSVSTYLSRWTGSCSEKRSVGKRVLIHFYIIETQV